MASEPVTPLPRCRQTPARSVHTRGVQARVRVVTVLTIALTQTWACLHHESRDSTQRVTLSGTTFRLELALTAESRFQGLSGRADIPPSGGMLFVFPRPRVLEFVMRRCPSPIDVIFLDAAGRIVAMHAMTVQPPGTPEVELRRYSSNYPAQFAIELAGGTLSRLALKPGMKIELPVDNLKQRAR